MKTEIIPYEIKPGELLVSYGRPHYGKSMPSQMSSLNPIGREMTDEMANRIASRVISNMSAFHKSKKK